MLHIYIYRNNQKNLLPRQALGAKQASKKKIIFVKFQQKPKSLYKYIQWMESNIVNISRTNNTYRLNIWVCVEVPLVKDWKHQNGYYNFFFNTQKKRKHALCAIVGCGWCAVGDDDIVLHGFTYMRRRHYVGNDMKDVGYYARNLQEM